MIENWGIVIESLRSAGIGRRGLCNGYAVWWLYQERYPIRHALHHTIFRSLKGERSLCETGSFWCTRRPFHQLKTSSFEYLQLREARQESSRTLSDMEALNQRHVTLRTAFTWSANCLDALLTAAQTKAADIEVIYEQMFERFKNLKDYDIRNLNLLQKDKYTQEDNDKEYNVCELYEDKIITYEIKVKNILAG
ncbi:uncharacterized protein TNCV_3740961 [Trichonephila clavipes]|nr:uncharacterized protein TNCV_3740961 [Trichonephila clavipes]